MENLKLGGRVCCGFWKCFYRHRHRLDVGYVVLQPGKDNQWKGKLRIAQDTWRLGETLEQNHSIAALMLAPPEEIAINEEFAAHLSRHVWNCDSDHPFGHGYAAGPVIVQRVRPAPMSSVLFGCQQTKRRRFYSTWKTELLAHVRDVATFRHNLAAAVADATALLTAGPAPLACLAFDFQAFVDAKGRLYHVDLDRCFQEERALRYRKEDAEEMRRAHLTEALECLAELTSRIKRAFPL